MNEKAIKIIDEIFDYKGDYAWDFAMRKLKEIKKLLESEPKHGEFTDKNLYSIAKSICKSCDVRKSDEKHTIKICRDKKYPLNENCKTLMLLEAVQRRIGRLEAENEILKAEKPMPFAYWKEIPDLAQVIMERLFDRVDKAEAEIKTIKKYACHKPDCPVVANHFIGDSIKKCTCGFEQALKEGTVE